MFPVKKTCEIPKLICVKLLKEVLNQYQGTGGRTTRRALQRFPGKNLGEASGTLSDFMKKKYRGKRPERFLGEDVGRNYWNNLRINIWKNSFERISNP